MLRFNKLASIILALVMAVTLLPGVTMTALAADANFSGSGTEADPFIIENNTKLLKLASLVNDNFSSPYGASTVYYKLSDDFDNSSEPFTGTIGNATTKTFHANFDGNQKTIHLNIEGGSFTYLGLLGYASGAVIKNLRTEGVVTSLYSTGTHYIGGIVGYATDTEIINCVSAVSISEKASGTVGGIVGYFGGTAAYNFLSNSCFIGSISNENTSTYPKTGGIVGDLNCINGSGITNCYSVADLNGVKGGSKGGIVGTLGSGAIVRNCTYAADATTAAINTVGTSSGGTVSSCNSKNIADMKELAFLDELNRKRGNGASEWGLSGSINDGYPYLTGTNFIPAYGNPVEEPGEPDGSILIQSETADSAVINLSAETIDLGSFTVAAYSTNGGGKWTKGALPAGDKFVKLFDKEMTLWVVDKWNDKDIKEDGAVVEKKGVASGATYIKFPKINARPKANAEKLAAYYANNTWTLMTKPTKTAAAKAPTAAYEYVKGNTSDGKMPPDTSWQGVPDEGFSILSKPEKSDKSKNVYYFRSMPSASGGVYTPGSKAFKISPAYYGAAYKYKIDYKKEELKLKKGDKYSVDEGASWTEVTEAKPEPLNVSSYITSGASIKVIRAATGAKPRTSIQTITPVSRATMGEKTLTCSKGKITDTAELKKYEILSKDSKGNDKWGNLPKVTESTEFEIRLKTDAKLTKDTWTGNAASATGKLVITYGVYDNSGKTPKSGIIKAEVKSSGTPTGSGTYSVTLRYNANAAVVIDVLVSNASNPYTLPAFPASKWTAPEGKVFMGWSLKADGPVISTSTIELTSNIDLYAIWKDEPTIALDVSVISSKGITVNGISLTDENGTALATGANKVTAGETFRFWIGLGGLEKCEGTTSDHSQGNAKYYDDIKVEYSTDGLMYVEEDPNMNKRYTIVSTALKKTDKTLYIKITVTFCEETHSTKN